jgi:hypothetical protein
MTDPQKIIAIFQALLAQLEQTVSLMPQLVEHVASAPESTDGFSTLVFNLCKFYCLGVHVAATA